MFGINLRKFLIFFKKTEPCDIKIVDFKKNKQCVHHCKIAFKNDRHLELNASFMIDKTSYSVV